MRDCPSQTGLYDPEREHSACGVGFLTRKDGIQSHDVLRRGHEALCAVPHRGGMSSEGVGDGAGVSVALTIPWLNRSSNLSRLRLPYPTVQCQNCVDFCCERHNSHYSDMRNQHHGLFYG